MDGWRVLDLAVACALGVCLGLAVALLAARTTPRGTAEPVEE